ncbi:hypothetical protein EUGRSUZ_L03473 [Eucalyptus grandis]|uniref:Uncharacterized protein n=1 Tax=Eucalyptus grandis TaxID=71139 RepID=A0AAD9T870_EUCGR|nr:hypothetical protein EUGRSUZ_L03473 [Eucalyptus grandis]
MYIPLCFTERLFLTGGNARGGTLPVAGRRNHRLRRRPERRQPPPGHPGASPGGKTSFSRTERVQCQALLLSPPVLPLYDDDDDDDGIIDDPGPTGSQFQSDQQIGKTRTELKKRRKKNKGKIVEDGGSDSPLIRQTEEEPRHGCVPAPAAPPRYGRFSMPVIFPHLVIASFLSALRRRTLRQQSREDRHASPSVNRGAGVLRSDQKGAASSSSPSPSPSSSVEGLEHFVAFSLLYFLFLFFLEPRPFRITGSSSWTGEITGSAVDRRGGNGRRDTPRSSPGGRASFLN